jgi:hypothetical protein
MKLNVGQVVYVILEKQTTVYPMYVSEEIIKRTMHKGEIVSDCDYILQAGGPNPKVLALSSIQGEIFETAEQARIVMIDRATKSINKHIEGAINKAKEWYSASEAKSLDDTLDDNEPDVAYVDLGNGLKGKIKI